MAKIKFEQLMKWLHAAYVEGYEAGESNAIITRYGIDDELFDSVTTAWNDSVIRCDVAGDLVDADTQEVLAELDIEFNDNDMDLIVDSYKESNVVKLFPEK